MTVRTIAIDGKSDTTQDWRLATCGLFVPASACNARTGVTVLPTLTGTGSLSCQISPFSAVIDGTSNSLQGGYPVTLDAAATVNINTGSAQSRIDLIGLQIQDNTFDGSGQHQGVVVYVAGTPGSGTAPATPANTIALFTVTVPALASSINFATAQAAVFPFTAAAGGIVPVRNSTDKPAVANAVQYRHRLDVTGTAGTTSPLEFSTDGTTWRPVFDPSAVPASTTSAITAATSGAYGSWTNLTLAANWSAFGTTPQYRTAPGSKYELRGAMQSTATINSGDNLWTGGPAPGTSRNLIWALGNGNNIGYIACFGSGVGRLNLNIVTSVGNGSVVYLDGYSFSA